MESEIRQTAASCSGITAVVGTTEQRRCHSLGARVGFCMGEHKPLFLRHLSLEARRGIWLDGAWTRALARLSTGLPCAALALELARACHTGAGFIRCGHGPRGDDGRGRRAGGL
jgi:hypothetical protein